MSVDEYLESLGIVPVRKRLREIGRDLGSASPDATLAMLGELHEIAAEGRVHADQTYRFESLLRRAELYARLEAEHMMRSERTPQPTQNYYDDT